MKVTAMPFAIGSLGIVTKGLVRGLEDLEMKNDTHILLWDFDIQTAHLISARRPDQIIINKNKRICKIVDFAVPADHRIKLKECEKKDKYLDLARELKKTMEREGDYYTNCDLCFWYSN